MAATATVDITGAYTINAAFLPVTNINTNTGSAGFDISGFVGNLTVITKCGAGASGTVIVPSLKAGADTNISNANNWVLNLPNFSNVAGFNVSNVDMRSSAFGSTSTVNNKYLYLTWLI